MDYGQVDFGQDYGSLDMYDAIGTGATSTVLGDVSQSGQDMQPYTSTGNGSGVFLDTGTQNGIFGALDKVLNYALIRDQVSMTRAAQAPMQAARAQVQVQQVRNNNLLLWLLLGGGVLMAVRK